jgi:TonB-linked SusC/RagA family outer membrane protein
MKYILSCCLLLLVFTSFAQQKFTLLVTDSETNKPIPSVKIHFNGPGKDFMTVEDGTSTFLMDKGLYNVTLSHVGYEGLAVSLNVLPGEKATLKMRPRLNTLQEVNVSTGYQTLPKERATGSFTTLNNNLLSQQVGPNILARLEAVSSGLIVDRSTPSSGRLMVRGLSTIRGPKSPLVVLDNFPYEGDIDNINPNDIESVTILKDAAAASIWGARAGNGVIVITSKNARFNSPTKVRVNLNSTYAARPNLYRSPQMNSAEYIDTEMFLYEKGFYASTVNSNLGPVLSPVIEILVARDKGSISGEGATASINRLKGLDVRDEYLQYFYRPLSNNQFAADISGGGESFNWISSLSYDHNVSNLGAVFRKLNARIQLNQKIGKNLQLNFGVYYTNSLSKTGRPAYGTIFYSGNHLYPYASFADADGNPVVLPKDRRTAYLAGLAGGKLGDWAYYPLVDDKNIDNSDKLADLLLSAGIRYRLPLNFSLELKYQFENQDGKNRVLYNEQSYFARNLVNDYAQYTAGQLAYKIPKGGVLDNNNSVLQVHNLRGQLNYNLSANLHELNGFIGAETRDASTDGISARLYGFRDDILTAGTVDYTALYPLLTTGASSYIPDRNGTSSVTTRFVSLFANFAYTYRKKYGISISGRRDASNLFGLNTNDKWSLLWSAGLSWDIYQEDFFKIPAINALKLRATYGVSGNIDPAMTSVTTMLYAGTSSYFNEPYARFNTYANPELRWENAAMFNLGLDFSALQNRLSGSIEYYHKKGKGLFGNALLDYSGGVGSSILKNVAEMSGNGLEVQLNSLNTTGNLQWRTALNFSTFRDKIDEYFLSNLQGSAFVGSSGNPPISGVVGNPVYAIYAYKWARLDPFTGDPQGYLNGQVSKNYSLINGAGTQLADLKYFGSAIPRIFGSVGNSFRFKNIELNIQVSYKLDYFFKRNSIQYTTLFGSGTGHADFSDRWKAPGDEQFTNVPSMVYPNTSARDNFYKNAEVLISPGDQVRLQYVNLSYTPKLNFKQIRNVVLYATVSNLGLIWVANKQQLDPDYEVGLTSVAPSKTISLGIKFEL